MPARWLLARICLAEASIERDLAKRIKLTRCACKLFEKISPTKLKGPVLLPGIRSEYPEKKIILSDNSEFEPIIKNEVIFPYRYLACSYISAASLCGFKDTKLMDKAISCCIKMKKSGFDSKFSLLNLNLVDIVIQSINKKKFGLGNSDGSIIDSILEIQDEIESAQKNQEISEEKSKEWLAGSYAALAVVTETGCVHEDALVAMIENIKINHRLVLANRKDIKPPDYFVIDPIYSLAISEYDSITYSEILSSIINYSLITTKLDKA